MKKFKKFLSLTLAAAMGLASFAGCGNKAPKEILKVYAPGEYIDMSLIADFEKEYNCDVIYETFDSNESMYTKIMSGEVYDVLVPSDYMIERLIVEKQLQPIDWSLISNKDNLESSVMGMGYDPDNTYSAPFFIGTVGIIYDTTQVDAADLADGWDLLKNTKYAGNIYMYDSERDSFMVALKALGYSMNTSNKDEIDAAYNWLIEQRDSMDPVYVGDDVIDNMISGNKAMAVVYSGDAAYIISENPDLDYFTPAQGTNEWEDSMVITANSNSVDLAHKYIDYMLSVDAQTANAIEVGYTPSVKSVADELAQTEFEGIDAFITEFGAENDEVFRYQDNETKQYFADMWTKVKAY